MVALFTFMALIEIIEKVTVVYVYIMYKVSTAETLLPLELAGFFTVIEQTLPPWNFEQFPLFYLCDW